MDQQKDLKKILAIEPEFWQKFEDLLKTEESLATLDGDQLKKLKEDGEYVAHILNQVFYSGFSFRELSFARVHFKEMSFKIEVAHVRGELSILFSEVRGEVLLREVHFPIRFLKLFFTELECLVKFLELKPLIPQQRNLPLEERP